jgi:serine/threonine-protein kinase
MIGQTLGHYRIVAQLGAGGMGVVYRARDERLDRDVALKVLPAGALADDAARRRFRKEALALAKLAHPNIAHIYDFDTQDGTDFLVMECVAGQLLAQRLAAGSLSEKELASLGAEIAAALEEAHDQGIIHRDLKPANILVTPKGQAKVLDFGLAKLLRPASAATTESFTETQATAGTLPYMAPEQLRGEAADARTDLFAAGAVLYEMSTGRRPFNEPLATRLADVILHQPPVSPRAVNPRVSPELERIILKCLEKEPENRYQSAKELGVDLRRLAAPGSATSEAAVTLPKHFPRRLVLAGAGIAMALVLVLLALNVGGWRARILGRDASAPGRIESVAVLPLANLSGDPAQDYFADGMTEALITDLAQIGALRVISRTSVMQYKGVKRPLPEIARELNVDGIIEGSVMRAGDQVRITAQLIYAPTDKHLWARSYDRDLRNVLALQSGVAQAIAREIQVKLTTAEESRLASARPVSPAAYEAYLKGRYHWNKRTPEGIKTAIEYFQQSVEKDPNYALAYAGLADCYVVTVNPSPPKEKMPKAKAAATKALQLDDTLAEAHTSLAAVLSRYDWDWPSAQKEFKRALELNPRYAEAHEWYAAWYLVPMGRLQEAIAEEERARELDPVSLIINFELGIVLYYAREYDQAIEQFRKTLELNPNFRQAQTNLAAAYGQKGMYEQAVAALQKSLTLQGGTEWPPTRAGLGYVYGVSGRKDEARKVLNEMKQLARQKYVSAYDVALIYVGLDEKDLAFTWLEKAYEERSFLLSNIKAEPRMDSLHSDPRFQAMLRRIGLPP